MIWLSLYLIGWAFMWGIAVGEGSLRRLGWLEIATILLWPVMVPVGSVLRWRHRRQIRWWNSLSQDERAELVRQRVRQRRGL
jgi:hypothetical protein